MTDIEQQENQLIAHARRELEAIKEDPQNIEGMLKVVAAFSEMDHSGGSVDVAIAQLNGILQFQNISPLTDNPDEWYHHGPDLTGDSAGVWQNKRNGQAFSHDGGKTYYLLSEGANDKNRHPMRVSRAFSTIDL